VLLSAGRVRGEGTIDELAERAHADAVNPSNLEDIFLGLT
jgi:hypothetical protein